MYTNELKKRIDHGGVDREKFLNLSKDWRLGYLYASNVLKMLEDQQLKMSFDIIEDADPSVNLVVIIDQFIRTENLTDLQVEKAVQFFLRDLVDISHRGAPNTFINKGEIDD